MSEFEMQPKGTKSNAPVVQAHELAGDKKDDEFDEVNSIATKDGDTLRMLQPRHVALIGIGGTIGTALFVAIGSALTAGGPASLLIAFMIWSSVIWGVNNAMSEVVTWLPLNSAFIRFAGRFVDEAFGVAAGWNFFVCESALVAFEVTACTVIVTFWDTDGSIPKAAWITIIILLYSLLNLITVHYYGESEFWFAIGKVLLITALIIMTFILMVGGNPHHDAFGFRYWKNPGAFAEYIETGSTGKFLGFFQCLVSASFVIAGPDYLSMAAGEAIRPRKTMPEAYRVVFARLVAFFVLGSLAVGILVPYNDPDLLKAIGAGKPGAAKSPYVIALKRLDIPVLPHIINAAVLLSAFSAGNSYVFCASRTLYGLALDSKAPRFFTKCSKRGVPYFSVILVLAVALLAFLSVSKSSTIVLTWFVNLVTASQLINFAVMVFAYLRFRKAMQVQGISRSELPYTSRFNPYTAYWALGMILMMIFTQGYYVFLKGGWDVSNFLFSYLMVGIFPTIFIVWKVIKRTKWVTYENMDLFTGKKEIDEDELRWQEAEAAGDLQQGKARGLWAQIRKFFF